MSTIRWSVQATLIWVNLGQFGLLAVSTLDEFSIFFTSNGHGLLEGEVLGDAEAVDEAVLVVGGKVVLADELVPVPRPGTAVEDAQTCLKGRRVK